jgi:hypothetical protein
MATIGAPEVINHDRRRFVETVAMGVAAIGTAGFPEPAVAAMPAVTKSLSASAFRRHRKSTT